MKKSLRFLAFTLFLSVSVFAQDETEKGVELYRNGKYDEAVSILKKSVEIDKKNRKAWTYLGASYFKLGNRKETANAFLKASDITIPKDSIVKFNDGLIFKEKPRPPYTDSARQNLTQGTVKIAVEFGADGKLKFAYIVKSLPNGLTENCIEALKGIKFEPAQKDGKPVSVVWIVEYSFAIY